MASSSSPCKPSSQSGVSKFLSDLPSRGLFSSPVMSSNMDGMQVYVCDHDTSPPEGQLIKTNQMNLLIRSLMPKKGNGGESKDVKGTISNEGSRKRPSERVETENATTAKKAMTNTRASSGEGGSKSRVTDRDLHSLTVERLRALLRENGLSPKGRKDELIARLKAAYR